MESMKEKEAKLQEELEQNRVHFEKLNKCIQELKDENTIISEQAANLKELNTVLDQSSVALQGERKANEQLLNTKASLESKLKELEAFYSGDNSPEYLKERIEEHKEIIEELKEDKEVMRSQVKELEEYVRKHEVDFDEEGEIVCEELRLLLDYFELEFADLRTVDIAMAASNPEREPKNKGIVLCITEMRKFIKEIKAAVAKTLASLEQDNEDLKKELDETLTVRNDAIAEISQLKDLLELQRKDTNEVRAKNNHLISQVSELKGELSIKSKEVAENERNVFCEYKEMYSSLAKLLSKYDGMNKELALDPEIGSKDAIIKLMTTFDELANRLNTEVKELSEKLVKAEDEKEKINSIQEETARDKVKTEEQAKAEQDRLENELAVKQQQLELLAEKYEKHNSVLLKEIEKSRTEINSQEERFNDLLIQHKKARYYIANTNSDDGLKLQKVCEVYLRALFSMLLKLKDLAAQKSITQKELKTYVALSDSLKEQLRSLGIEAASINRSQDSTQYSLKEIKKHKKYLHLLKFRKSAIAVCAVNRLLRFTRPQLPKSLVQVASDTEFPQNELSSIIGKAIKEFPKEWSSAEELSLVSQSLKEVSRLHSQSESNLLKSPLLADTLREGLLEIGSKCNWLTLGVPSELQSFGIECVDKIFYKDLLALENAKQVERCLKQAKLVPKLEVELASYKDQEADLVRELQELQAAASEYEKKVEQLSNELELKERNSVSKEVYQGVIEELRKKEEDVEKLARDLVRVNLTVGECKCDGRQN
eukprot:TRINITY_DN4755_c0_g1_i5.p1 TRINITY_DN4755_c0_g1~~TRINITY_DN4755_c0_g1_i5.p1  ORF type:complete len:770 (-),score=219.00 TRINITY_DN4755_c0_g1_i5:788-3097(-)